MNKREKDIKDICTLYTRERPIKEYPSMVLERVEKVHGACDCFTCQSLAFSIRLSKLPGLSMERKEEFKVSTVCTEPW